MIHSSYLAYARDWQQKSFDQTVTVVYYTTTSSHGSTTVSGCTTASYLGRLWEPKGGERPDPAKITEFSGWKLALPHNAAISASCNVYINSTKYSVKFTDDAKSNNAAIVVDLERAK